MYFTCGAGIEFEGKFETLYHHGQLITLIPDPTKADEMTANHTLASGRLFWLSFRWRRRTITDHQKAVGY